MEIPNTIGFSIRDFFHVLFKRKIEMMLFFSITVLTVAVGTYRAQPTYEASSQILVKIGRENLYLPTVPAGGSNPVISLDREKQINSEIEILKSRHLAEEVVNSIGPFKMYPDFENDPEPQSPVVQKAVMRFQSNLDVEAVQKSDVINIKFKHHDPEMAAEVVNAFVSAYLDRHVQIHKSAHSYEFFHNQSEVLRNALRKSEESLEGFKRKNDVSSLNEERTLLLRQEADHRALLNQTLSQEAETERRIHQLRLQLAETPKTIPREEEVNHNPGLIENLQAQLVELDLKEKELLIKYTEKSRLVQNVREEIEIVRSALAERQKERHGISRSGSNPTFERLQQMLLTNEADLKAIKAKREIQSVQLSEYQKALNKLNRIEVDMNQIEQKVDVDRQNYRLYLSKFEESRISDAMDTEKIANVSLVEPAKPPFTPISPKVFLNLALALFIGLFGGLGLAFFLEYMDDTLEKADEVEQHLQLPVLASVPKMRPSTGRTS